MINREFFLQCWKQEYPTFVKVLRAVPPDKLDYRPDSRSRSAGELVWLQVLEKRCWFELLDTGKIDWKVTPPTMSLDTMTKAYQKAHTDLAPHLDAIHHRGQLTVYIRPMGGKVPSIYGPSADDPGE
jgi:hypothetical protein